MPNRYNRNRSGRIVSRTGAGGTYPVNNNDPQCDDPEADEAPEPESYEDWADRISDLF